MEDKHIFMEAIQIMCHNIWSMISVMQFKTLSYLVLSPMFLYYIYKYNYCLHTDLEIRQ